MGLYNVASKQVQYLHVVNKFLICERKNCSIYVVVLSDKVSCDPNADHLAMYWHNANIIIVWQDELWSITSIDPRSEIKGCKICDAKRAALKAAYDTDYWDKLLMGPRPQYYTMVVAIVSMPASPVKRNSK